MASPDYILKQDIQRTTHRGFTLMEVMVSISIFAIIITIGIGSLLTIFKTLQQTRADRQTLDSVSYIIDTMTRRIRTAESVIVDSTNEITITDQDGKSVIYSVRQSSTDSGNGVTYYELITTDDAIDQGNTLYTLTPKDFKITNMEFVEKTGNGQPLVEIHLAGLVKNGQRESKLLLQTAVSVRKFSDTAGDTGQGVPDPVTPAL